MSLQRYSLDKAQLKNIVATRPQRHQDAKKKDKKLCETLCLSAFVAKEAEQLQNILQKLKRHGKKIVFTNGCFDLLHIGHIKYLQKAKKLGHILVVALNTDNSVRKIKGEGRPLMPEQDRAGILAALRCVDYVVLFNETTPAGIIKFLKPDILVKGSDYQINEIVGRDAVKMVKTIPLVKGKSTSSIIKKIYRIIDANLNRSREGLRVIEDITRFVFDDKKLTGELKKMRHKITGTIKNTDLLLHNRESGRDVGRRYSRLLEGNKKDIKGLLVSNFRRVEESLRVLEDISKMIMRSKAGVYKNLRFSIYILEKTAYEALCNT